MIKVLASILTDTAKQVQNQLNDNGIANVIVGGIAVGAHANPRATEDVDFLILESDVDNVKEMFPVNSMPLMSGREGFTTEVNGLQIDFIIANQNEEWLFEKSTKYDVLNVAGIYNLIYLKLNGRSKDSQDIIQIIMKMNDELKNGFRKYLINKMGDDYRLDDFLEEYNGWVELA